MSRKLTFAIFVPIVVLMVVLDRMAKDWAVAHLRLGMDGPDFGLVDLTLVHNEGAAFGMGQGSGAIFMCVALLICVAAIAWLALVKRHYVLETVALALIVAGGIGNLVDRLTTGYVVDFIRFTFVDFPVFNVADICVTCGVVLFLIAVLFTSMLAPDDDERHPERSREQFARHPERAERPSRHPERAERAEGPRDPSRETGEGI